MSSYGESNSRALKCAKKMLRYVKGTIDFRLTYERSKNFYLEGYSDSDYVEGFVKGKISSCVIF